MLSETAAAAFLSRVVFSYAEWFGREFREFACIFGLRDGIPSCFLFRWKVWKGIPRVCFYFISTEWNWVVFLPLKGSEGNSESLLVFMVYGTEFRVVFSSVEGFGTEFREFLYRGTVGIPSEMSICSVNSVFRGIIFLSEIPNLHDFSVPIFHYSLFFNVFDVNAAKKFLLEPKERCGGGQELEPLLLSILSWRQRCGTGTGTIGTVTFWLLETEPEPEP
jgi:hypothetical protein